MSRYDLVMLKQNQLQLIEALGGYQGIPRLFMSGEALGLSYSKSWQPPLQWAQVTDVPWPISAISAQLEDAKKDAILAGNRKKNALKS